MIKQIIRNINLESTNTIKKQDLTIATIFANNKIQANSYRTILNNWNKIQYKIKNIMWIIYTKINNHMTNNKNFQFNSISYSRNKTKIDLKFINKNNRVIIR